MEHYRLRKYRGPEVWARVRAAYEAGESGPSVARRLDVGLTNLRKKCRLEGWSRRHQAERLDRELAGERIAPAPQTAGAADGPVDRQAALAACIDHAAAAMARGDGQKALAALRAAQAFTEVSRRLDEDPPEEPTAPGRRAAVEYLRHLRAVHAEAAELARRMMAETCDGMAAGSGHGPALAGRKPRPRGRRPRLRPRRRRGPRTLSLGRGRRPATAGPAGMNAVMAGQG